MGSTPRSVLRQAMAYAEKDLSLSLRFKFDFLSSMLLPALINLGIFSTIFYGFFQTGASTGSGLTSSNYVVFTLLGALAATLFNQGFGSFQGRFIVEKYWQTAYGILASPLSAWAILLGVSLSETVRFALLASIFLFVSYILYPVSGLTALLCVGALAILYVIMSGLSLLRGAVYLVNENVDPLIQYFVIGTSYLSCFYYPSSFLPSFLRPFALINPVYYVVTTLRGLWLGSAVQPSFVAISIVCAVISPILGTYAFKKVWRNRDISGY